MLRTSDLNFLRSGSSLLGSKAAIAHPLFCVDLFSNNPPLFILDVVPQNNFPETHEHWIQLQNFFVLYDLKTKRKIILEVKKYLIRSGF